MRCIDLRERGEEAVPVGFRDPHDRIGHDEPQPFAACTVPDHGHVDVDAAVVGELHRVPD
jgi:hypothetical protein